jgi:outer membrane protein TolC
MNKIFSFVLIFILLTGFQAYGAETINKGDVLNLQQCIDIALQKHPSLNAAAGTIRASESKIGQARAGYYPQLTFQSNYQRNGPSSSALLRSDPYNQYSNYLNLSQNIFDFGKTSTSVEIQSLSKESSLADQRDIRGLVIFNVKQFYYGFLQGRMSLEVAQETVSQFEQHYEITKVFFETGKSSKIDVTSAEVNLSNARINLLKAENALRIAKINLNNAMGLTNAPEYEIKDDLSYRPDEVSLSDALQKAYQNRPDLLSITKKKEGLEKTIDLNKKGYLPVLSGNAAYGYTGDDLSMDKAWNVGVTLTFPLFTGLSTKYQVEEARANLDVLRANEDTLKQKVYLEVESAYLSHKEAEQRISAGRIVVQQAEERLELAKGRYAAGAGSYIEITDAMISLNNAKMTYITALSDYSVTQASLQKAMGVTR